MIDHRAGRGIDQPASTEPPVEWIGGGLVGAVSGADPDTKVLTMALREAWSAGCSRQAVPEELPQSALGCDAAVGIHHLDAQSAPRKRASACLRAHHARPRGNRLHRPDDRPVVRLIAAVRARMQASVGAPRRRDRPGSPSVDRHDRRVQAVPSRGVGAVTTQGRGKEVSMGRTSRVRRRPVASSYPRAATSPEHKQCPCPGGSYGAHEANVSNPSHSRTSLP